MSYHLTYAEAIITGLIQGVTELFPVSSLGHNVLLPALIGGSWAKTLDVTSDKSPYLAFVVGLHVATAIAMIAYFRRDWLRIVRGFVSSVQSRSATTPDEKLAWMIILATIPVGIVGAGLQKVFTHVFAKPSLAALFLAVNGAILLYSERQKRRSAALAGAGPAAGARAVPVGARVSGGDAERGVRRGGWDGRRADAQGGGRGSGRGGRDEVRGGGRDDIWGNARDDRRGGRPGGRDGRQGGGPGRDDWTGGPDRGYPRQPPQGYQQQPRQQQWQGPRSGNDDWQYGSGGGQYGNDQYGRDGAGRGGQRYEQDPWAPRPGRREQYGQDPRYSQGRQYEQGGGQYEERYDSRRGRDQWDQPDGQDPWDERDSRRGAAQRQADQRRARDPWDAPDGRNGQGGRDPQAGQGRRQPPVRRPGGQEARPYGDRRTESGVEADRAVAADRRLSTMGYKRAVLIGSAQIVALLPGISRDGIVTVAGLWRGLSREDAIRFSFLLSAPVILAAGMLKASDLFGPLGQGIHGPVLIGSLLSGIGAYLSIRFLTRYFSEERSLNPFGVYCLVAGLGSLAYLLLIK